MVSDSNLAAARGGVFSRCWATLYILSIPFGIYALLMALLTMTSTEFQAALATSPDLAFATLAPAELNYFLVAAFYAVNTALFRCFYRIKLVPEALGFMVIPRFWSDAKSLT